MITKVTEIRTPSGERYSFEEARVFAIGLALTAVEEIEKRNSGGGIHAPSSELLKLTKEIREGGPVVRKVEVRVSGASSLRAAFCDVSGSDTIELYFLPGENGFAALSALARLVEGTAFEDQGSKIEQILSGRWWPTSFQLISLNIPNGMSSEEVKSFVEHLAWEVWPGLERVQSILRLGQASGRESYAEDLLPTDEKRWGRYFRMGSGGTSQLG
jgi:hypothetical protein